MIRTRYRRVIARLGCCDKRGRQVTDLIAKKAIGHLLYHTCHTACALT